MNKEAKFENGEPSGAMEAKQERTDVTARLIDMANAGDAFHAEWDDLCQADDQASIFLSRRYHEWIAKTNGTFRLLEVRKQSKLIGLMPLGFKTNWNAELGRFQTDLIMPGNLFWADYCGYLAHPDWEQEVSRVLGLAVRSLNWNRLYMENWDASEVRRDAFLSAFDTPAYKHKFLEISTPDGSANNLICPRLDLPDSFESYLSGLGRNSRQKLRRLMREFDDGDMVVRSGQQSDIKDIVLLWRERWAEEKGSKIDDYCQALAAALTAGILAGDMSFTVLISEGKMIGALCHYLDPLRKRALFFVGVRDMSLPSSNIGMLLHAIAIQAFIEKGWKTYDFLRGDEEYKFRLGAKAHDIIFVTVARDPITKMDFNDVSVTDVLSEIPQFIDSGALDAAKVAAKQVASVLAMAKQN